MSYTRDKINLDKHRHAYGTTPCDGTDAAQARHALAMHVAIHPDGQAWTKCCRQDKEISPGADINCAFVDGRLSKKDKYAADIPFMCVHRSDKGYLRICAGWDACFGKAWRERNCK